jgi:hypothetical protein
MGDQLGLSKIANCLFLLAIVLSSACEHRSSAQVTGKGPRTNEALTVVERCRTEAKQCRDYAGSPSARTVCEQEFRSCLAGLVQDGGGAAKSTVATGASMTEGGCIEDVRACLVAMSAPTDCANRASECLEASARGGNPSAAQTDKGQSSP